MVYKGCTNYNGKYILHSERKHIYPPQILDRNPNHHCSDAEGLVVRTSPGRSDKTKRRLKLARQSINYRQYQYSYFIVVHSL